MHATFYLTCFTVIEAKGIILDTTFMKKHLNQDLLQNLNASYLYSVHDFLFAPQEKKAVFNIAMSSRSNLSSENFIKWNHTKTWSDPTEPNEKSWTIGRGLDGADRLPTPGLYYTLKWVSADPFPGRYFKNQKDCCSAFCKCDSKISLVCQDANMFCKSAFLAGGYIIKNNRYSQILGLGWTVISLRGIGELLSSRLV